MAASILPDAVGDGVRTRRYGQAIQGAADVVRELLNGGVSSRGIFAKCHQRDIVDVAAQGAP
jgi:hypothetical protein